MAPKLATWLFFVSSCAVMAQVPGWKTKYDLAIKEYEAGNYDQALTASIESFNSTPEGEMKSRAYTAQLITVTCLDNGNASAGLDWIDRETALFLQLEGSKSKSYLEALSKHARLLVLANRLPEAETKCQVALQAYKAGSGDQGAEYADLNFLYAQVLAGNNKLKEAVTTLDQCVDQYSKIPDAGEQYVEAMLLSAQLSGKIGDKAASEKKYKQLVSVLEKSGLQSLPAYGVAQTELSRLALASGNTAEAEKLLKGDAIGAVEKARQLLKIALDYHNRNQPALAAENYALAEKAVTDGNLQDNTAFSIHINYAILLMDQKKFGEATSLLARAEELSKVLYHEPSAEVALLNFTHGDLSYAQGNADDAHKFYLKAKANSSAMSLPVRVPYLTRASYKLLMSPRTEAAIGILKDDMGNLPNESVPDKVFMEAVVTYTNALTEHGHPDLAIKLLRDLELKVTSAEGKLKLRCQEAVVLDESGQWSAALKLLTDINGSPSLPKDLKIGNDFLIGRLHLQLGNFGEAEKFLIACSKDLEQMQDANSKGLILDVTNSLAIVYTRLGNYGQAEALYQEMLKNPEPAPGFHASIQQNLAALYVESARYKEAQALLEDVVARDLALYGDQHPNYATALQNLAAVYQKSDQIDKARQSYEKALQINSKADPQGLSYATTAANLGIVYHDMGDLNKALQYITESLKIREKKLGKDHPDYVFNEYNLANLLEEMGKSKEALAYFRNVASFTLKEIRELFSAMSEREKTAYYNRTNAVITAYLDFGIKHSAVDKTLLPELYDFRLATKALLLNSSTKIRNRILSSRDAKLMEAFTSWLDTKEELGKLYTLGAQDRAASSQLISSLQKKANDLEKSLASQSELFSEDAGQDTITWKSVKASLAPGDAAIEMIRLGLSDKDSVLYAALVLRPENPLPQLVVFPYSPRLETREFSYYRNAIQFHIQNERSYRFFWKPLESALTGVKRIYLSADGVFNKVSVATLYDPATKQYLIEKYSIGLVSNTRELLEKRGQHTGQHTATLIGNPDFGTAQARAGSSRTRGALASEIVGSGIAELPGTLEEINKVDGLLKQASWNTTVLLAKNATEQAIKIQQSPGVLHIATHGFFVPALDDEPVVAGGDLTHSENNPLLRSGLILAGVGALEDGKSSAEDGILTAYEAMNLTLDRTDLVVLSACETGAGEVKNGEGVYGLQRSFLVAGAANLLMSLWKVDDAATQELMLQLYKEMQTTSDKQTAFRNTQLEIRKRHAEPYYWGGFVLIGHD